MPCPVCLGECTCGNGDDSRTPRRDQVTVLIDPEHYNPSEERFSETLGAAPPEGHLDVATELEASARAAKVRDFLTRELTGANAQNPAAAVQPGSAAAAAAPEWKHEVATRVSRFRTRRRPRPERTRSLTLNFEAATARATKPGPITSSDHLLSESSAPASATTPVEFSENAPSGWDVLDLMSEGYATQRYWPAPQPEIGTPLWRKQLAVRQASGSQEIAPANALDSEQFAGTTIERLTEAVRKFEVTPLADATPVAPPPVATGKIIEFPQTVEPIEDPFELAGPVIEAPPRIFEAEEIPEPASANRAAATVPSVVLDSPLDAPSPAAETGPMVAAAPLKLRAYAGIFDSFFVAAGLVLFALVTQASGVELAPRALFGVLSFTQVFLLGLYQYLFLTCSGATPGMRQLRLSIRSFDARPVSRARRRARAFAFVLSSAALGLGFLWSLLDEDRLGWHDRITHTYLAQD